MPLDTKVSIQLAVTKVQKFSHALENPTESQAAATKIITKEPTSKKHEIFILRLIFLLLVNYHGNGAMLCHRKAKEGG